MTYVSKFANYVKESLAELKKVVWPTKKQLINYTLVVFGMFIGVAIFFAVLDNVFNKMVEALIK